MQLYYLKKIVFKNIFLIKIKILFTAKFEKRRFGDKTEV